MQQSHENLLDSFTLSYYRSIVFTIWQWGESKKEKSTDRNLYGLRLFDGFFFAVRPIKKDADCVKRPASAYRHTAVGTFGAKFFTVMERLDTKSSLCRNMKKAQTVTCTVCAFLMGFSLPSGPSKRMQIASKGPRRRIGIRQSGLLAQSSSQSWRDWTEIIPLQEYEKSTDRNLYGLRLFDGSD